MKLRGKETINFHLSLPVTPELYVWISCLGVKNEGLCQEKLQLKVTLISNVRQV